MLSGCNMGASRRTRASYPSLRPGSEKPAAKVATASWNQKCVKCAYGLSAARSPDSLRPVGRTCGVAVHVEGTNQTGTIAERHT